jgi:hypothetical protein
MKGSISQQSHFVTSQEHRLTRGEGHLLHEIMSLGRRDALR